MALKSEKIETPQPPVDNTVLLELSLYTNYMWQGQPYEKGKAYRFKKDDAMILLGEQDHGRPVWRVYRAPKPKAAPTNLVVDATNVDATQRIEPIHGVESRRIDVGDDSEIADVLAGGDVTL